MATVEDFANDEDVKKIGYLTKLKTGKCKLFVLRGASERGGPARLDYYDTERSLWSSHRRSSRLQLQQQQQQQPKRSYELDSMVSVACNSDGTAPGSTLRPRRLWSSRGSTEESRSSCQQFAIVIYTKVDWLTVVCETETEQQSWFNDIILLRNKQNLPYEHIWQVTLRKKDLLRHCSLLTPGVYLFCVSAQMVSLLNVRDETTVDIPANYVKNIGLGDREFMMDVGRSSITGPGRVWMAVADNIMVKNIYETILGYMKVLKPLDFSDFSTRSGSLSSSVYRRGRSGSGSVLRRPERSNTIHSSQPLTATAFTSEERVVRPVSEWSSLQGVQSIDTSSSSHPYTRSTSESGGVSPDLPTLEEDSSYMPMSQHDPSFDFPASAFITPQPSLAININLRQHSGQGALGGSSPTRAGAPQSLEMSADSVFRSSSPGGASVLVQRSDSREGGSVYLNMTPPPPSSEILRGVGGEGSDYLSMSPIGGGLEQTLTSRTSSSSSSAAPDYCNVAPVGLSSDALVTPASRSTSSQRISNLCTRLSSDASISGLANHSAAQGSIISGLANYSAAQGTVVCDSTNQSTAQGTVQADSANNGSEQGAGISDSANHSSTQGAGISAGHTSRASMNSSVETLRGSDSYMMMSPPGGVNPSTNGVGGRSVTPMIGGNSVSNSGDTGESYMMMSPHSGNSNTGTVVSPLGGGNMADGNVGGGDSYMVMSLPGSGSGAVGEAVVGQSSSVGSARGVRRSEAGDKDNFDEYVSMNIPRNEGYMPMKRGDALSSSSSVCSSRSSAGSIIIDSSHSTDSNNITNSALSRTSSQLGRAGDSGYMEMRAQEVVAALRPRLSTISYKLSDRPGPSSGEQRSNSFGSKPLTTDPSLQQLDMTSAAGATSFHRSGAAPRHCPTVDEGSGGSVGMSISAPHLNDDPVNPDQQPDPTTRGRPPHHPRGAGRPHLEHETVDDRLMPLDFTRNSIHSSREDDLSGTDTLSSRSSSGGAKDLPRKNSSLSSMSKKFFSSLFSGRKDSGGSLSGISVRRKGSGSSSSRASSKQRGGASRVRTDSFGLPTDPRPRAATVENRPRQVIDPSASERQCVGGNRANSESAVTEQRRGGTGRVGGDSDEYMAMHPPAENKGYMDMSFSGSLSRQISSSSTSGSICAPRADRKSSVDSMKDRRTSVSSGRVSNSNAHYMDMTTNGTEPGVCGDDTDGRLVTRTDSQYMDMNPANQRRKSSVTGAGSTVSSASSTVTGAGSTVAGAGSTVTGAGSTVTAGSTVAASADYMEMKPHEKTASSSSSSSAVVPPGQDSASESYMWLEPGAVAAVDSRSFMGSPIAPTPQPCGITTTTTPQPCGITTTSITSNHPPCATPFSADLGNTSGNLTHQISGSNDNTGSTKRPFSISNANTGAIYSLGTMMSSQSGERVAVSRSLIAPVDPDYMNTSPFANQPPVSISTGSPVQVLNYSSVITVEWAPSENRGTTSSVRENLGATPSMSHNIGNTLSTGTCSDTGVGDGTLNTQSVSDNTGSTQSVSDNRGSTHSVSDSTCGTMKANDTMGKMSSTSDTDDNRGSTQLVSDNTGSTQLVSDNTGITQLMSDNTGSTQLVSDNTGSTQLVSANTGSTQLVSDNTGSTQLVSDNTGSTQLVSDNTGSTQLVSDNTGSTQLVSDNTGSTQLVSDNVSNTPADVTNNTLESINSVANALQLQNLTSFYTSIPASNPALDECENTSSFNHVTTISQNTAGISAESYVKTDCTDGATSAQLTYATLDLSESDGTHRPFRSVATAGRSGVEPAYTEIDFSAMDA